MAKLTPKQRAFVREYKINGGNGTQAAIKAGYSEKTARKIASENVTKPDIREELEKQDKKLQEKYEYTIDELVKDLKNVLMQSDSEGNRTAQLRAIELLGKAFGLFVDKSDIRLSQPPVALVEVINKNGEVVNVCNKNTDT